MDLFPKPDALFELAQVCQMPADEVRAFIKSSMEECASYKYRADITSWNPFDVANLLNAIKNNVVNPFTNTPITNLGQACDHAAMECDQLRQNDLVERGKLNKTKNAERQKRFRDNVKKATEEAFPELVKLKRQLAQGLANRKALVAQWDAYIKDLRIRIQEYEGGDNA